MPEKAPWDLAWFSPFASMEYSSLHGSVPPWSAVNYVISSVLFEHVHYMDTTLFPPDSLTSSSPSRHQPPKKDLTGHPSVRHQPFLPIVRISDRKWKQQAGNDRTEWPSHGSVGGTKAPFWRLQPQQLRADALGFLLSRGWSVKIGAGTGRVSLLQFYRFRKFTTRYQLKSLPSCCMHYSQ